MSAASRSTESDSAASGGSPAVDPTGGVYEIDGVVPVVDPTAFVHPSAVLIGDVVIGAGCYVGPGASLRGDMGRIQLGRGSNVQDNCVLHCFPGRETVIEEDGHIGHQAVLHGCRVGRGVLIGIGSVVMDGVVVGERSFVGAHSFVPSDMRIAAGRLVLGAPARDVRPLTEAEMAWKAHGTEVYRQLAIRSRQTLRPAAALTELPADRGTLSVGPQTARPLREYRAAPEGRDRD